jgi:hypothetical protein
LLGDAESLLGDAKSSLGDAKSLLGDAKSLLGDAECSLGGQIADLPHKTALIETLSTVTAGKIYVEVSDIRGAFLSGWANPSSRGPCEVATLGCPPPALLYTEPCVRAGLEGAANQSGIEPYFAIRARWSVRASCGSWRRSRRRPGTSTRRRRPCRRWRCVP